MTAPARFRQSDLTRLFKSAEKAGVPLSRIEICPSTGRIVAFTGAPSSMSNSEGRNPWDEVLQ